MILCVILQNNSKIYKSSEMEKEIMEARYADIYPHRYKRFEYDR